MRRWRLRRGTRASNGPRRRPTARSPRHNRPSRRVAFFRASIRFEWKRRGDTECLGATTIGHNLRNKYRHYKVVRYTYVVRILVYYVHIKYRRRRGNRMALGSRVYVEKRRKAADRCSGAVVVGSRCYAYARAVVRLCRRSCPAPYNYSRAVFVRVRVFIIAGYRLTAIPGRAPCRAVPCRAENNVPHRREECAARPASGVRFPSHPKAVFRTGSIEQSVVFRYAGRATYHEIPYKLRVAEYAEINTYAARHSKIDSNKRAKCARARQIPIRETTPSKC